MGRACYRRCRLQRARTMARTRSSNLRKENVIAALFKARGLVSLAAKLLRCSSDAVYGQIKRDPEIAAAALSAGDVELDRAESKLFDAIRKGESWAVSFFLARKGKCRGYSERQELTGKDGGPLSTVKDLILDVNLKKVDE